MITARGRTDLYPSRIGGEEAILPRQDPVVYERVASRAGAPLRQDQIDSYARNGYLHLPGFLSELEVEAVRREGERIRASRRLADADEVVHEPDSGQVRSIFRFHQLSAAMDRVSRHPRLVEIVRFLLADDVYFHQTRINYKGGFRGKEFYWHSDFETWHVEDGMPRMRALSASIALTENNALNGPLMVVPGSHHHYMACAGDTPADHHKTSLRKQEYGVPGDRQLEWLVSRGGIEAPVGPAGSLLLFECNTMHGSGSNITPWPRSNLFIVYNSVSNRLEEPFGGIPPRPEHIANRSDCEPIRPAQA